MNMRAKTRIMSERLKPLAEKYGVALHYQDALGNTVLTKINVVALLSQKMGVLFDNGEEEQKDEGDATFVPPVMVVRPFDEMVTIKLSNVPEQRQLS